jgi:hypothetical protein
MQKSTVTLFTYVLWSLVTTSLPSHAAGFILLEQSRYVEAESGEGSLGPATRLSAQNFALFEEMVESSVPTGIGQASQVSDLSDFDIRANGAVYTSGITAGIGRARSEFEILFEVTEATTYSLAGSVFGSGDGGSAVRLLDAAGSILHVAVASPNPGRGDVDLLFSFVGTLSPGQYSLIASAISCSSEISFCGEAVGWGNYSARLIAVPETSTAILLGVGLSWLAERRSERDRSRKRNAA